jgi:hypothetical protein
MLLILLRGVFEVAMRWRLPLRGLEVKSGRKTRPENFRYLEVTLAKRFPPGESRAFRASERIELQRVGERDCREVAFGNSA